jgi:hypothetical protein
MIKKDMFAGGRKRTFEMAAALRKQPTLAEDVLWGYLRSKPWASVQKATCLCNLGFRFLLPCVATCN